MLKRVKNFFLFETAVRSEFLRRGTVKENERKSDFVPFSEETTWHRGAQGSGWDAIQTLKPNLRMYECHCKIT